MPAKVLGSRDGRRSRNVPILPILSITVATLFLVSCSGGEAADAGYEVRLGHTSNGFEGDGTSFGGGYYGATSSDETPPDYTRDVVAAVRIGAPDLSLCRNDPNPV